MSIDTHIKQSSGDDAPEGREPSAGGATLPLASFDGQVPPQPEGDALPLDGSLSLNDTEPIDQTEILPNRENVLTGSEAGGTASARVRSSEAVDTAVDQKSVENLSQNTQSDSRPGQVATGGQ